MRRPTRRRREIGPSLPVRKDHKVFRPEPRVAAGAERRILVAPCAGIGVVEHEDRMDFLERASVASGFIVGAAIVGDMEVPVDSAPEVAILAERLVVAGGAVGIGLHVKKPVFRVPPGPVSGNHI